VALGRLARQPFVPADSSIAAIPIAETKADSMDGRLDVSHRVTDSESSSKPTDRHCNQMFRVDVDFNRFVRIVVLQIQQLGND